jgi:hypothetical protein
MLVRYARVGGWYIPRVYTGSAQSAMRCSLDVMSPFCQLTTVCVAV